MNISLFSAFYGNFPAILSDSPDIPIFPVWILPRSCATIKQSQQMPDFVSPEYESAIFVIAKKDSDYFAFVDKSYSKIKMLLESMNIIQNLFRVRHSLLLEIGVNNYDLMKIKQHL